MCKHCDKEIKFEDMLDDDEDMLDENSDNLLHAQELTGAKAFFMAVLEESAPDAIARYKAAENHFTDLLDQIRLNEEAGITDYVLTQQSNAAFLAVAEAKFALTHSLDKVAYKMTHMAHA